MNTTPVVELVDEKMQEGAYIEGLKLCLDNLVKEKLSGAESEELTQLSVKCLIYMIPLQDFYKELYEDPDTDEMIPRHKEEYNDQVDWLEKQISLLAAFLTRYDRDKFERIFASMMDCVKQSFLSRLDEAVFQIRDKESFAHFTQLNNGFNCLCCVVINSFAALEKEVGIKRAKVPKLLPTVSLIVADKFIEQADRLDKEVGELSFDFPYYALDDAKTVVLLNTVQIHLFKSALDKVQKYDPDNYSKLNLIRKGIINVYGNSLNTIAVANGRKGSIISTQELRNEYYNERIELEREIRKTEPGYTCTPVDIEPLKVGACYVATAVYGSYDCPEVWVLRRYRDNVLEATVPGRLFVRIYYTISPLLVKWFGDTMWFKNLCKAKLDRMVSKLKGKGVKDTPYQDKTHTS